MNQKRDDSIDVCAIANELIVIILRHKDSDYNSECEGDVS